MRNLLLAIAFLLIMGTLGIGQTHTNDDDVLLLRQKISSLEARLALLESATLAFDKRVDDIEHFNKQRDDVLGRITTSNVDYAQRLYRLELYNKH